MHPDLVSVIALWDNIDRAEQLQQERKVCQQRRQQTLEASEQAVSRLAEARGALELVLTEERAVMRKLDSYRNRVRTTKAMLDAGKAPDYRLAEQQLRACTEIVDQLETEALEQMEARDEAEAALAAAEAAVEQTRAAAEAAVAHERARLPLIDAALAELDLARPALEAALPIEQKGAFRAVRTRGRSAVAPLRDGACALCNFGAPSQVVNEIVGHHRVHTCRNCGRFLVPEDKG